MASGMIEKDERVVIHTDGACSGNPGPGGWGAILEFKGQAKELSGGSLATTNNRMELTAAIEALSSDKQKDFAATLETLYGRLAKA